MTEPVLALCNPRHPLKPVNARPFQLADLEEIAGADPYASALHNTRHIPHTGLTFRGDGERTILCAGIFVASPGLGDAWLLPGPAINDYGRETYVHVWRAMKSTAVELKLRRLQATTRASRPQDGRFLERLGFEREGRLRKLYEDDDAIMYARVF